MQERIEQGAFAKKTAGDIRTWIFSELVDQDVAVEVSIILFHFDGLKKLIYYLKTF